VIILPISYFALKEKIGLQAILGAVLAITATEVENPASARLLEKLGARLIRVSDHSTIWEIRKVLR
jgi:hypothetical protein